MNLRVTSGGGGVNLVDPYEEEIKRRQAQARASGWKEEDIQRFTLIDRAQKAQQDQVAKQNAAIREYETTQKAQKEAEAKKPKGWKKFGINAAAFAGSTLLGLGAAAAAPFTGGASLAAGFAGGMGIEALRRRALGEEQDLKSMLLEGGLTVLPGVGKLGKGAVMGAKAAKAAKMGDTAVDITKQTAAVAKALGISDDVVKSVATVGKSTPKTIAMKALQKKAGQEAVGETTEKSLREALVNAFAGQQKKTLGSKVGDSVRATNRGIRTGTVIPGSGGKALDKATADTINTVVDKTVTGKLPKTLRGQVDAVQTTQKQIGTLLTEATKKSNFKLEATDYDEIGKIVQRNLDDIGDVLTGKSKQELIDKGLKRILYDSTDLVSLEKQRKIFDEGARRLLQNPDSQGTITAQIQRAFREGIDEFITAKKPELKQIKGAYRNLRQAEDLLVAKVRRGETAGEMGGIASALRFGAPAQIAKEQAGKTLQTVGRVTGSGAAQEGKWQLIERAMLNPERLGAPSAQETKEYQDFMNSLQLAQNKFDMASQPTIPFTSPQNFDETAINQMAMQGADPQAMVDALYGGGQQDPLASDVGGFTGYAGVDPEMLVAEAMNMLAAGDVKAAKEYMTFAKNISDLQLANKELQPEDGGEKLSSAQQKDIGKLQQAGNIIDQIEAGLGAAGLKQGGLDAQVSGIFRNAAGSVGLDDQARIYKSQREGYVAALAKSLGEVGSLSDSDKKAAIQLIPNLTDSEFVAKEKIRRLRELIGMNVDTVYSLPKTYDFSNVNNMFSQGN